MLTTVVLPVLLALNAQMPTTHDVQVARSSVNIIKYAMEHRTEFVAGHHGGGGARRGPGPDHGDDPNDEQHDGDLPANKEKGKGKGPSDPYAGSTDNNKNNPFTPY